MAGACECFVKAYDDAEYRVVCKACAGRVAAAWGVDSSLSDEYRKVVVELESNRTALMMAKAAAHDLEVEVAKLTRERDAALRCQKVVEGHAAALREDLRLARVSNDTMRADLRREQGNADRARREKEAAENAYHATRLQLEAREKELAYARERLSATSVELTGARAVLNARVPVEDVLVVVGARDARIAALEAELRWAAAEVELCGGRAKAKEQP